MKNILLVGFTGQHCKSLNDNILLLGGSPYQRFSKDVECLVCKPNQLKKPAAISAQKANIPIVSETWIEQSIQENKFIDHLPYLLIDSNESDGKDWSKTSNKRPLNTLVLSTTPKKMLKFSPSNSSTLTFTPTSEAELESIRRKLSRDTRVTDTDPIFVNRTQESKTLGKLLCQQKSSIKGVLPILSQHYGSGKTQLVVNFRRVIEKENLLETTSILETLMKAVLVVLDFQKCAQLCSKRTLLKKALSFMEMDFNHFKTRSSHEINSNDNFEKSLTILGICKNYLSLNEPYPNTDRTEIGRICYSLLSEREFASFSQTWSDEGLWPVILFFDEYQCLAGDQPDNYEPLVEFWQNNLTPLMGKRGNLSNASNVFTVVAGKSSNLTKIGRGLLLTDKPIPLTPACHLVLDMLNISHITTIMEKTELTDKYSIKEFLYQFFSMSDDSFQYFCKKVYIYTGGIPRLVKYVIDSMITYVCSENMLINLSTRSVIDEHFDNPYLLFSDITQSCEISYLTPTATNSINRELEIIILLGIFGVSIPFNLENCSTINLIHYLNVGVEKISDKEVNIIIPKFTLLYRKISGASLFFNTTLSLLKDTNLAPLMDKGCLLERLVLETLVFRLIANIISKKEAQWKDVHDCFAQSSLGDLPITFSEIVLLPKITSQTKLPNSEIENIFKGNPWARAVSDENWKELIFYFFQKGTFQIGVPAPKSKSGIGLGDIILFFHPDKVCNLVIKNYSTTKFNCAELQEEINKCSLMLPYCSFVSVVVFCSNLCPSIQSIIGSECLCLNSGVWSFNKKLERVKDCVDVSLEKPRCNNTGNQENTVHLFKNMELILFGIDQFRNFFTKEDVALLESISQNMEPTFELLSPWIKSNMSVKLH